MAKAIRKSRPRQKPSKDTPSLTSMGFLLHVALRRLSEGVMEALEGTGIHSGQLGLLGALTDAGPMNQRRLSELTLIDKSSVVLFLDGLEKDGWVRRLPDPDDRRAHIVEITEEGASRFAELGKKMQLVQDRFLAPLDPEERDQIVELLERLGEKPV
jgi:DNA-binding MarR family transcriptional regulator